MGTDGAVPRQHGRTLPYRTIIGVFRPLLLAGTRRDWRGLGGTAARRASPADALRPSD